MNLKGKEWQKRKKRMRGPFFVCLKAVWCSIHVTIGEKEKLRHKVEEGNVLFSGSF